MKSLSLSAALLLAALSYSTLVAPSASAQPTQTIKIGDLKLKDVKKKNGKLRDGKLKTPFGKAKVSNGKIKARL